MRLDKFLKVSRLIRRRSVAKSVADEGRCRVNDRPAKPSTLVAVGDRVELDLPRGSLTIVVRAVRDVVPAAQAADLYEVISAPPADD